MTNKEPPDWQSDHTTTLDDWLYVVAHFLLSLLTLAITAGIAGFIWGNYRHHIVQILTPLMALLPG